VFDGPITGYIDNDRAVHVLARDGTQLRTFRAPNHPGSIVFSNAGDRIGAISHNDLVVFDATGKQLHTVPLAGEHPIIALRGEHTWVATADGMVRHFVGADLAASIPAHVTDIHELAVSGNVIATLGSDTSLAILDANAAHVIRDKLPCENAPTGPEGIAYSFICERGRVLYIGRTRIAVATDPGFGWVAHAASLGRAALAGDALTVFGADARPIASATSATGHVGAVAFEDADHLLVLEPRNGTGLWRWTISANRWDRVAPGLQQSTSIAVVAGGLLVGFIDGQLLLFRDGKEVRRIALGNRPELLSVSADRQWAAAQLANGGVAIINGKTGELVRTLAPADNAGAAPMLDEHGELVIRGSRGKLSVWDRLTGEELVYNLDLLNGARVAAFDAQGRLEGGGRWIGLVDIPRETRSVRAILADIACKIPLRVVDGRLAPAQIGDCPRAPPR